MKFFFVLLFVALNGLRHAFVTGEQFFLQNSSKIYSMALSPTDPNSFSRPDLAVINHVHLDLKIDFTKKILDGFVVLDIERKEDTNFLILDVQSLVLLSITNVPDGSRLDYRIEKGVYYGSKLSIQLPESPIVEGNKNKYKIKIEYRTSQDSKALQWLDPEQTAGGKYPYMFSQNEAINARSMLPCQDTPSVKFTYSAEIRAPSELNVLMSALKDENVESDNAFRVHKFNQPVKIPSYLIALVAGRLVSKQIGPRTKVWTEKELLERSVYEFEETETMLKTAEELVGPYVWGIYDLLILPPSFPYGGMENPCLTFVTPTLLAGDRSLANVVIHEITHSWTGNLVTNDNYENFWLNEGFTRFIERKIIGKMYGDKMRHFDALEGLQSLKKEILAQGETGEYTKLIPNFSGIDPGEQLSEIPYEKGHTLLFYLEELLGGPEVFNAYLRNYIETYKYKSLSSSEWKDHLYKYFENKNDLLNTVDWKAWFYKPGDPPIIPKYDTTLVNVCKDLVDKWINNDFKPSLFSKDDLNNWSSNQKVAFLSELILHEKTLSIDQLKLMSELYYFDSTKNAEIRCEWLQLCIKSKWDSKVDNALEFVTSVGRKKYLRPIYRGLYAWEEMRQRAIDNYLANRDKLFFVTRQLVAKDLHLTV